MPHDRRHKSARSMGGIALLCAAAALTVACQAEPAGQATGEPTPSISAPTGGPSPTPIETSLPDAGIQVPADCEQIYSAGMLDKLEAENPPLNDPGVTMLSTQNVDLLQIIDESGDTLRCSWGGPGEFGLATTVTAIDADQAGLVERALAESGFACEPLGDGSVCRVEKKGITQDDQEYTSGETHYIAVDGWVSTAWLNFTPDGYTEDIVATIWG